MYDVPAHYVQIDPCQSNPFFWNYKCVVESPAPSWVMPIAFEDVFQSVDPVEMGCQCLLIDRQINIETQTMYTHRTLKVINAIGISEASNLRIYFDPAFENLIVHDFVVYRNGQQIRKLNMDHLRIIQREEELENQTYDETLTALFFLEDIREGDILDFSFSHVGFQPLFGGRYFGTFPLQYTDQVERYFLRIIKPPGRSFFVRHNLPEWNMYFTETIDEYCWHIEPTPCWDFESNQPRGYCNQAKIEISEFSSWNECAKMEYDLFLLNPAFGQDPEVIELLTNWRKNSSSLEEVIIRALRFVQDEIRYLGLQVGIYGWKPCDALLTLKRRFGDCKNKTQLFRSFLDVLGVSSYACLVNTRLQGAIANCIPNIVFNHTIVRIDLPDREVFVDPVQMYQGGDLFHQMLPRFGYGLIVSQETQELTPIQSPTVEMDIDSHATFIVGLENQVELKIRSSLFGSEANDYRYYLNSKGLKKASESNQKKYAGLYGTLEPLNPLKIEDDRVANKIVLTESYRLTNPWKNRSGDEKTMLCYSNWLDFLDQRIQTDRKTPLALYPPRIIKETISIQGMDVKPYEKKISHKGFDFSCTHINEESDKGRIEFELRTHLDSISPEELESFSQKLKRASASTSYRISIPID